MASYSIKELGHLSGIKPHTIRMWELRYKILKPQRSCTNIRSYDDDDLKAILNISMLNQNGYRISKIAHMSEEEIGKQVMELATKQHEVPAQICMLLTATMEMEESIFEKVFATSMLQLGFERTITELIFPCLHKVGLLWQTGTISPAQEHFISHLVRQKIAIATEAQVLRDPERAPRFLLFLPEAELHEIGLLYLNYLIKARNGRACYLGQTLSYEHLVRAAELFKPEVICSIFTVSPPTEELQPYLDRLGADFPETRILIGGTVFRNSSLITLPNIQLLGNTPDMIPLVEQVLAGVN